MKLRATNGRWFAGLTWKGYAGLALLSLLNAFRRNSWGLGAQSISELAFRFVEDFGTALLALSLMMLAVVAAYNALPAIAGGLEASPN